MQVSFDGSNIKIYYRPILNKTIFIIGLGNLYKTFIQKLIARKRT